MEQLREQLRNELRAELRDELRADFAATIQELQQQRSSSRRPKASLPDPEKFTGTSYKFDTWDAAIRAKLAIDGPAIGDATAQFYYVYLNLDSKVQATFASSSSSSHPSTHPASATNNGDRMEIGVISGRVITADDLAPYENDDPVESAATLAAIERVYGGGKE